MSSPIHLDDDTEPTLACASHKVGKRERAFGRLDPAGAFHPPVDAEPAGGQFDEARNGPVEAGDDGAGDYSQVRLNSRVIRSAGGMPSSAAKARRDCRQPHRRQRSRASRSAI
jgi:hypothetical protein